MRVPGALAGPSRACPGVGHAEKDQGHQLDQIGHRDTAVPFSYFDDNRRPIGYSVDLCMKIVDAVKLSQKLPKLDDKYVLVGGATRIPLTANGTVDLECGTTTNNTERHQQVSFAVTTFVAASRLAWKKNAKFKTPGDLKGKSVVAVAGQLHGVD